MRIKTSLLTAAAVLSVSGATALGFQAANAHGGKEDNALVERIASKFNLSEDEFKAVFEEIHDERQAERQQQFSIYLQQKVDDGTITLEQKTLIEEKLKELDTKREELREQRLTRRELHEQMDATRKELRSWADVNNIPLEEIIPLQHRGVIGNHHRVHRAPMH